MLASGTQDREYPTAFAVGYSDEKFSENLSSRGSAAVIPMSQLFHI
jgi:hypothetical protein